MHCARVSFLWIALKAAVVAFASANVQAEGVAWQAAREIARGEGEKGPWRQNDSRYDYVDDPAVAIDGQGNLALAWVDQRRKDVFFRRIAWGKQKGETRALNISRSPSTFSWLPRIRHAPDDPRKLCLVWQEIVFSGASHGGEILFAGSDDGGISFAPPVNVSRNPGGDGKGRISGDVWHNGSYDLALGPGGTVHVAWTEYDGMLWMARSADGGKSFSAPVKLAGSREIPARGPSIAIGREGEIYLAWTTGENDAADILLARSDDGGATFGPAQPVAASLGYSDAPKLAVDAGGVLHLAYAESDGGPFGNYHIRYTRSLDGGRSFAVPRKVSAALPLQSTGAAFPSLVVGDGATVAMTWEIFPAKGGPPRGLGFTVSRDGGQTFAAPGMVPGSADPAGGANGSQQGLLMEKLALGPGGALAVVNSSLKPGVQSRVWLMRGTLSR